MRRGREEEGAAGAAARSKRKMERGRGQGRGRRARRERGLGPRRRAQPGHRGPPRAWRGRRRRGVGAWVGQPGSRPGPSAPRCAGAPGGVGPGRSQAGPRPRAGGPGGGERAAPRGWPWPPSSSARLGGLRPRRTSPPRPDGRAGRPELLSRFRASRGPVFTACFTSGASGPGPRRPAAGAHDPRPPGRRGLRIDACGPGGECARSGGRGSGAAEESAAVPLPVEAAAAAAAEALDAHWRNERSPRRRGPRPRSVPRAQTPAPRALGGQCAPGGGRGQGSPRACHTAFSPSRLCWALIRAWKSSWRRAAAPAELCRGPRGVPTGRRGGGYIALQCSQ